MNEDIIKIKNRLHHLGSQTLKKKKIFTSCPASKYYVSRVNVIKYAGYCLLGKGFLSYRNIFQELKQMLYTIRVL